MANPILIRHDDNFPQSVEAPAGGVLGRAGALARRMQAVEMEIAAIKAAKETAAARRAVMCSCGDEVQQCVRDLQEELMTRKRAAMPQALAAAEMDVEVRLGGLIDADSKPLKEALAERDSLQEILRCEDARWESSQAEVDAVGSALFEQVAKLELVDRGAAAVFKQWNRACQELEILQVTQQAEARKLAQDQERLARFRSELMEMRNETRTGSAHEVSAFFVQHGSDRKWLPSVPRLPSAVSWCRASLPGGGFDSALPGVSEELASLGCGPSPARSGSPGICFGSSEKPRKQGAIPDSARDV